MTMTIEFDNGADGTTDSNTKLEIGRWGLHAQHRDWDFWISRMGARERNKQAWSRTREETNWYDSQTAWTTQFRARRWKVAWRNHVLHPPRDAEHG